MSPSPYLQDSDFTLYCGDSREVLSTLPAESVHMAVTSPPFWGLRDYQTGTWEGGEDECDHVAGSDYGEKSDTNKGAIRGGPFKSHCGKCGARRVDSQIGLEATPEEWVAQLVSVFEEVRRVLRKDGTLFVEIGDSYWPGPDGLNISREDAAWLAALIDGEGCVQVHKQKREKNAPSYQVDVSVSMRDWVMCERAHEITGLGSLTHHDRTREGYGVQRDWCVRGQQAAILLRTVYPWLTLKKRRAAIACAVATDLAAKKFGRGNPVTDEALAYRESLRAAVCDLNQRRETDVQAPEPRPLPPGLKAKDLVGQPDLLKNALKAKGWYHRSTVIWSKVNCMPESCRDRPTQAHSYVLLFSKNPRYFFDAEAVREAPQPSTLERDRYSRSYGKQDGIERKWQGAPEGLKDCSAGRNARSVWTIATEPLPFEHYAAFPQALAERCIKAGTSERGCCPECGAPWMREVERGELVATEDARIAEWDRGKSESDADGGKAQALQRSGFTPNHVRPSKTLGWSPSCKCGDRSRATSPSSGAGVDGQNRDLAPIPAVVLDPFLGSGTTALVSRRLGRRCIGVELNERYCDLAAKRTQQLSILAEDVA